VATAPTRQRPLESGDAAPWFVARCTSNAHYRFDTVGGRYVVLSFLQSARHAYTRAVVDAFLERRDVFDDLTACFFGVTVDATDEAERRLGEVLPGYRIFWDFDGAVSRAYGRLDERRYLPATVILDKRLRVLSVVPMQPSVAAEDHVADVVRIIERAEEPETHAPVLVVPRIFEPAFCERLIDYYRDSNPQPSGFMQERDGRTVVVANSAFKRRRDCSVEDETLRLACRERLVERLKPQVFRAFQFLATYAERYIVSCYDANEGGFFRPHRDNTTKGTAHRRFAVTINLNTGEYDGGCLRFPEFGSRTYEAPLGGAVVFSCSLMHVATPVTRGSRYAFLPFLYDDAAARVREQNLEFVDLEQDPAQTER
jgi:predicted 2-oxoglutarate/Fe(II)-dependent dioxygenase YbiX/peroxiredoxin